MDFFDVINTRKTIRKYKEDHPPIEDIKRIIDAGRLAPSATNTQNWKFIAIYNRDIKEKMVHTLIAKYEEIKSWKESEQFANKIEAYKSYSTFFIDAPVVIASIETQKDSSFMNDIYKARKVTAEDYQQSRPDSSLLSMGAAIENMSLAAHALGYGTCWMCAPIVAYKEFKQILNISEDDKIISLLTVGVPENSKVKSPPKKLLEEVIRIIE